MHGTLAYMRGKTAKSPTEINDKVKEEKKSHLCSTNKIIFNSHSRQLIRLTESLSDMHKRGVTQNTVSLKIQFKVSALYTDFLLERGKSRKLCPGESVLPGEESPVLSLEPGEQPWIL